MKKARPLSNKRTIDEFQFLITPLSLKFNKKQPNNFFIYIQKGAQVLGKIRQEIICTSLLHIFNKNQVIKFRIANQKAPMTYQWSLYRITNDQQEEYFQSIGFNLKEKYHEYIKELQRIQDDLYRIYNQKQKKTQILQIWKDLRYDLLKRQCDMTCVFTKIQAKVYFKFSIRCQLDFLYDQWIQSKQKKRIERQNSLKRKSSANSKSRSQQVSFVTSQKQKSAQIICETNIENSQNLNKEFIGFNIKSVPQRQFLSQNQQKQDLNNQKQKSEYENIRQSQIKILDPQGIDVTANIPQKFLNNKRNADQQAFYTKKKTSMLSDIIQESYEGSSNINLSKSNQAQRLKSVDQLRQQDQSPLFSPIVKTQTFQSQKHDEMFSIKRTSTFRNKPSQQYDYQENQPKTSKKSSRNFHTKQIQQPLGFTSYQVQADDEQQMQISQIRKTSSRRSSQIAQQQKQFINQKELKYMSIRNMVKIVLVVILLLLTVSTLQLFSRNNSYHQDQLQNQRKIKNKNKITKRNNKNSQKSVKSKSKV